MSLLLSLMRRLLVRSIARSTPAKRRLLEPDDDTDDADDGALPLALLAEDCDADEDVADEAKYDDADEDIALLPLPLPEASLPYATSPSSRPS